MRGAQFLFNASKICIYKFKHILHILYAFKQHNSI